MAALVHENTALSSADLQTFIVDGYLVLPPDPAVDHGAIFAELDALRLPSSPFAEGNLGNNVLPAVPELLRVADSPAVRGALEAILGAGYLLLPHRTAHRSNEGPQAWHRDYFAGEPRPHSAAPYHAQLFYYPQAVPEALGPTEVLPRSQYYGNDDPDGASEFSSARGLVDEWGLTPRKLVVEAGAVALVHYGLWHRGGANATLGTDCERPRYLVRLEFSRLAPPAPAPRLADNVHVYNACAGFRPFFQEHWPSDEHALKPLWGYVWNWLTSGDTEIATRRASSAPEGEPRRVAAVAADAYWAPPAERERADPHGATKIVAAAFEEAARETRASRRAAAQAVEWTGANALPALLARRDRLSESPALVVALGRICDGGGGSPRDRTLAALTLRPLAESRSVDVAVCAAEALGCLRGVPEAADALLRAVERRPSDDARVAALHGLLRHLPALSTAHRRRFRAACVACAGDGSHRYVAAFGCEGLHRLRFPFDATPPLLRWDPFGGRGW